MTLAKYGHLSYAAALNFTSYMANETHYVPWLAVRGELFSIRDMLDSDDWKVCTLLFHYNILNLKTT